MPFNQAIVLRVMTGSDFVIPACVLLLLVLISALLSPYPLFLIVIELLAVSVMLKLNILSLIKVNDSKLTLIIFPDGLLRLESTDGERRDGFLGGQQWATQAFAILRFENGNRNRKLVVLSRQQPETEGFRRLTVMLRQNFYNRTESGSISGV